MPEQGSAFRDFSRQQHVNHMFPTKEPLRVPWFWICSLLLVLGLGLGSYFVLTSPRFYVLDTAFVGVQHSNAEENREVVQRFLATKHFGLFPQNHMWFLDVPRLQQSLFETGSFESVDISLRSNTLFIAVSEKPLGALLVDDAGAVFTDLQGRFVRQLDMVEQGKLLADERLPYLVLFLEERLARDAQEGQPLLPEARLTAFQALQRRFPVMTGLQVQRYSFARANAYWVRVVLADDVQVYVDLDRPLDLQLGKLSRLLERERGLLQRVAYIDLRYPNRVYYK